MVERLLGPLVLLATAWSLAASGAKGAEAVSVSELKDLESKIQAAAAKVGPCVVGISGGGSGVVVSADGYILTVAHVGERSGRNVWVTFPDGRRARGTTLGNDYDVDAGLVKLLDEGPWPYVEMGRSGDLEPGQWCLTFGYPVSFERGKAPVLRVGRVLRARSRSILADCKIMGGDSGGPLFDLNGKVIGIGSRCDDQVTYNLHVPVDCYRDHWDRLTGGEDFRSRTPEVAFLGVGPGDDPDDDRIDIVFPDSAAEKAGIKLGDVIVKFDGQEIGSYDELPPLIAKKRPGDKVSIEVRRGEEILQLKVELGRRYR